jgi:uncharacterized protein YjdB
MYRITLFLLAFSLCTTGIQGQANVDESIGIIKTLYIDNQHSSASDANAGTSVNAPLMTLGAAVSKMATNGGNRIIIYPGVYRERVQIATNHKLILERAPGSTGEVAISGAERFQNWTPHSGDIYRHHWPHNWGLAGFVEAGFPSAISTISDYTDLERRREMVFVNGQRMEQVLSYNELGPGRFYVDEGQDRLYLQPPSGIQPNSAEVEVPVLAKEAYGSGYNGALLWITPNHAGLVLRGLTVRHTQNYFMQQAVHIRISNNTLVEHCDFSNNGGVGFTISDSEQVSLSYITANANGERGMGVVGNYGSEVFRNNILLEHLTANGNNWRFKDNEPVKAWDAAGAKLFSSLNNVTLLHCDFSYNFADGLWFDWNNHNITIDHCTLEHNTRAGLTLEASCNEAFPTALIRNTTISHNETGLFAYGSSRISIEDSQLFGNYGPNGGQLNIGGDGRTVFGIAQNVRGWSIRRSAIYATDAAQLFFRFWNGGDGQMPGSPSYQIFSTITADSNYYFHPAQEQVFASPDPAAVGASLNFDQWKAQTSQDLHSVWGLPAGVTGFPPVARLTADIQGNGAPAIVHFDASASFDPNGAIISYFWNFGDGQSGSGATPVHTYQQIGKYKVQLTVQDNEGLSATAFTEAYVDEIQAPNGGILQELWFNVGGESVSQIPLQQEPSQVNVLGSMFYYSNDDNYGNRLSGYLFPPVTGHYQFFIASDDQSEFWLSTDRNPGKKQLIAFVPEWTFGGQYDKYPSQASDPIWLVAGQKYFIEALHKEGAFGDHVSAGWIRPGNNTIEVIPGSALAYFNPPPPTNTTIPVTGVSVSPTTLSLTPGEQAALVATVSPANATNPAVSWSSSNPAVATVNSSGLVSAVAQGTAAITATTVDGGFTAAAMVAVVAISNGACQVSEPSAPCNGTPIPTSGNILLTDGGTYVFDGGEVTTSGTLRLTNGSALRICSGTLTVTGTIQLRTGTLIIEPGAALIMAQSVSVGDSGNGDAGNGVFISNRGHLGIGARFTLRPSNGNGSHLALAPGATMSANEFFIDANSSLTNQGDIELADRLYLRGTSSWDVCLGNQSTITTGRIQVSASADNADKVVVNTGSACIQLTGVDQNASYVPQSLTASPGLIICRMPGVPQSGNFGAATVIDDCTDCGFAPTTPVTGLSVSPATLSLNPGQQAPLTATVSPADATNPEVSWSSSDPAVATVSSSGLVSAVAQGTAAITATTVDGGFTAAAVVTVELVFIPVSGISVSPATLSLNPGQQAPLTATVSPADATNPEVSWSSSDPAVATVSSNGLVSAVAQGTAAITATTVDGGFTAATVVTVELVFIPVSGLSVSPATLSLNPGQQAPLTATVSPADATNPEVSWSSSDPAVATVSSSGLVSAVAQGTAAITATTVDGSFTAAATVAVVAISNGACQVSEPSAPCNGTPIPTSGNILLTDGGTYVFDGGEVTTSGTLRLTNGSTLRICSGTLTVTGTIQLRTGTLIIEPGAALIMAQSVSVGDSGNGDPGNGVFISNRGHLGIGARFTLRPSNGNGSHLVLAPGATMSVNEFLIDAYSSLTNEGEIQVDTRFYMRGTGFWDVCLGNQSTIITGRVEVAASVDNADKVVVNTGSACIRLSGVNQGASFVPQSLTASPGLIICRMPGVPQSGNFGAATVIDGCTDCGFTPIIPVTGVSISPTALSLNPGQQTTLTTIVSPADATDPEVSWSSSDPAVATVSSSGLVSAVAEGVATITATTWDGGYTAAAEVTISSGSACTNFQWLSKAGWSAFASMDNCGQAQLAIDDNLSTTYQSCGSQTAGMYLQIDLGSLFSLSSVEVNAADVGNDLAQGYELYLSTDGQNYGAVVGVNYAPSPITAFSFPAQSARYIRLVQTGDFWADWRIREVSAYGCAPEQYLVMAPRQAKAMKQDWREKNFYVFPNPSLGGQINLSLPAPGHLSVRDIMGRMVIPEFYREEGGIYSPVWKLPAGIYLAVLRNDGHWESVKFVIK